MSSISLHFRKMGQGPELVILHGLFGSSDNWLSIARKLENNFTVFIPDLRNHGQSPHTSSHTYEEMTEDLKIFFEVHNIRRANILGHSMGGKLAMMFGAVYPEKVNNLIIADIAPKLYKVDINDEEGHQLILDLMEKINFSHFHTRREIDEYLSGRLIRIELRQFLLKNIYRDKNDSFRWKINVPVLKRFLKVVVERPDNHFFNDYKPIRSYPVTFIRGLKSNYISDNDLPLILDIYPEAKIIDIPQAGHWLHAEQPDDFVKAVLESVKSPQF